MFSSNTVGSGPVFNVLRGVTVSPGGQIYTTDVGNAAIYVVNPTTGNHTLVASGFGGLSYGIAVYPTVPEPASIALLALGSFGLIRRKRGCQGNRHDFGLTDVASELIKPNLA